MNETERPDGEVVAGELLASLGRELKEPLRALIAEIHVLDERHAEDDGAARLVELGYALQSVLEPIAMLAELEEKPASNETTSADWRLVLERTVAAPSLAAGFELAVRGDLGTDCADEETFRQGLALCLDLVRRMTVGKTRLQVHREVHAPSDRIVLTTSRARERQPMLLALLKRAAETLGASVDVDGPALFLALPAPVQQEERPSQQGPVLAFRREERSPGSDQSSSEPGSIVLVVDHEPAARSYMSRILDLEGFDVVTIASLEEAYEAAHAYRPDAMIVDRLQLAHEGGDWVRRFKKDPALARIPLILVQSEESEALGLVGIAEIVRKPIDPDEVIATVGRLTGAVSPPILVVRDDEDAGKWDRCVDVDRWRMVTASSVPEAERILDSVTPSALVVDVRKMDGGLALVESLRRSERTADISVVAVHGRLTKRVRLQLSKLADRCMTFSALDRRSLGSALDELVGYRAGRSDLGTG